MIQLLIQYQQTAKQNNITLRDYLLFLILIGGGGGGGASQLEIYDIFHGIYAPSGPISSLFETLTGNSHSTANLLSPTDSQQTNYVPIPALLTSFTALVANLDRKSAYIRNDFPGIVYISFSSPASDNSTFQLFQFDVLEITDYFGNVYAYADGQAVTGGLAITELTI